MAFCKATLIGEVMPTIGQSGFAKYEYLNWSTGPERFSSVTSNTLWQ